ncbi:MAG: peptide chain release factor N(5)-glutamine methyltransferase [Clostridia bacterium]|nr:peptide chain release factor N(5)-glutamine methyltransferase [Clostridia bacterium]
MSTYSFLRGVGKKALDGVSGADAAFESMELLGAAAGLDRTALLLKKDEEAPEQVAAKFYSFTERRLKGEPLQYIIGTWDFCGFSYTVGPGVLIPRPETEELAFLCEAAIKKNAYKVVYDLCAGTGCIGLTLARLCPEIEVRLFEKYPKALSYLKKNVPEALSRRVRVIEADVLKPPRHKLPLPDLIVSNPPYIESAALPGLQKEVLSEPLTALDGGDDGLTFYRAIAAHWLPLLPPGGFAAFECGETQAEAVSELMKPFGETETLRDFYGNERFVTLSR